VLSAAIIARVTESNSAADVNARDAAIVASIPVQCGANIETIRKALCSAGQVARWARGSI
jgi:hypothetical protein